MLGKEKLKRVVQLQYEEMEKKEKGIAREIMESIDVKIPHAIILSGIRRSGKSTLLNQMIKKTKKYCYFNFEDPRAVGFLFEDFELLNEVYTELMGNVDYYFFDEIQNVGQWERFVRFLLDQGKKCIITGSNASLLSKELGTKLTGRHLSYEIFPFSYEEMLLFTKKHSSIGSFNYYFFNGGFPEFLVGKKKELLQELLYDILARDIVMRYGLRETKTIKELLLYLITNIGKEFSYNKLATLFKLGSPNSVIAYISYFEDSYLLFTVPRFDYSYKKQIINPKKVYSIDVGFANANSLSFSEDKGRVLENMVFLQLRRKYKTIYYYRGQHECDFIVSESGKITAIIQVCYALTEENKEREFAGLREAMAVCKVKEGVVITYDQEAVFDNISVIPAWKWLCKRA